MLCKFSNVFDPLIAKQYQTTIYFFYFFYCTNFLGIICFFQFSWYLLVMEVLERLLSLSVTLQESLRKNILVSAMDDAPQAS